MPSTILSMTLVIINIFTDTKLILIHVSDFHFGDNPFGYSEPGENREFSAKRFIGWLNYQIRRKRQFSPEVRERLFEKLGKMNWDYLIITGDLTTFSLEKEFSNARKSLEPLLNNGKVILTPGNHDRYVKSALNPDLLASYFNDCFPFRNNGSESDHLSIQNPGENIIIIELDMSVPRNIFSSRGKSKVNLRITKISCRINMPIK